MVARAPRMALSQAQRNKIRDWRSRLGHAIWNLNESLFVHELRRKYEVVEPWSPHEIGRFSKGIKHVYQIALKTRDDLQTFVKRGGRLRKDAAPMADRYLNRLAGAAEGASLGASYLVHLIPDNLDRFIDAHLGDDWDPGMIELIFFGYCPAEVKSKRALREGPRIKAVQQYQKDKIAQLLEEERAARWEGLEDKADRIRQGRLNLEKKFGAEEEEPEGCYTAGVKMLRAAVMQMFYTLQAKDIGTIRLNKKDSENWHKWEEEIGEPPPSMTEQFIESAKDENRVLLVYDNKGEWIYEAFPPNYAGEDPESLKERAALKQSKRARKQWHYDYQNAVIRDPRKLSRSLDHRQRRKVTEFLQRYPHRTFTIEEIAWAADVPVHDPEEAARFQASAAAQFAPNPNRINEIAQNRGLVSALWTMSL